MTNVFLKNRMIQAGSAIVIFFAIIAIFAPLIATHDPAEIDSNNILMPPSKQHILGTDSLGRDVFSRIVYGARISLSVGVVAVGIALFIGIILGSLAGFFGGKLDYNDCDGSDLDYEARGRVRLGEYSEDGEGYYKLQNAKLNLKPITMADMKKMDKVSAYDLKECLEA